ncbi:UNVERIFIED_CONTAM: hypothetical protein NCL1_52007 [Trichonephila clavipes]
MKIECGKSRSMEKRKVQHYMICKHKMFVTFSYLHTIFDPLLKKKKKKKKMPFDPSALEDNSISNEGEFQQDDDENFKDDVDGMDDKEDTVLDLDDFSGFKKKKKKKKPFNLDDLDSGIPESEGKDESSIVISDDRDVDDFAMDDDLDFSLPKKKKKKKKINIDELDSEFVCEDDEEDETKFGMYEWKFLILIISVHNNLFDSFL